MLFKKVAEYFRDLEDISSRIEMTNKLSKLLAEVDEDSIDKLIYLIQGILYPDFYGYPELGLGEKLIIKAISMATLTPEQKVIENLYKLGDLGEVIYSLKSSQKSKDLLSMIGGKSESSLTVQKVHEALTKIAQLQGESSRDLKIRLLAGLLKEATPLEAKYIVRFVDGKLRLGVGDATIMDALAIAVFGSDSYREKIERAYNLRADLGNIAKIIKKGGLNHLKTLNLCLASQLDLC
jgi:ATP-dependent DNA ligase